MRIINSQTKMTPIGNTINNFNKKIYFSKLEHHKYNIS